MKRKLLISVLASLGIVVGGVAIAYAVGTFKANQQGYRQGGEGQAARITMRVEAGMADPNSELIPDDYYFPQYSPGGALSFSIANTSDLPLQVTKVEAQTIYCGTNPDGTSKFCQAVNSNKNTDGTFTGGGSGSCGQYASFVAPANYNNWPTIAPHATLQVNGTDNNRLGAGTLHLANNTPQGCQGATFIIGLNVTAAEATTSFGFAP